MATIQLRSITSFSTSYTIYRCCVPFHSVVPGSRSSCSLQLLAPAARHSLFTTICSLPAVHYLLHVGWREAMLGLHCRHSPKCRCRRRCRCSHTGTSLRNLRSLRSLRNLHSLHTLHNQRSLHSIHSILLSLPLSAVEVHIHFVTHPTTRHSPPRCLAHSYLALYTATQLYTHSYLALRTTILLRARLSCSTHSLFSFTHRSSAPESP
ncbi:hypothetical protein GQ42DRAFT_34781 [Ramicandelaber brevisporus]|nr:hypothetical protein GQ42DRAFT_34781 [Ramicandelaber brevisporus]